MDRHGNWRLDQLVETQLFDNQLVGHVRAIFYTRAGELRFVVEHSVPAFLYIYPESSLLSFKPDQFERPTW